MATHEMVNDQMVFVGSNIGRIALLGVGMAPSLRLLEATADGVMLKATHMSKGYLASQLIAMAEKFVDEGTGYINLSASDIEDWT